MKFPLLMLLAALPVPLSAQSFEGASGELQYQHYDDGDDFTIGTAEGYLDAAWKFGVIGTQVGLSYMSEVDSSADIDFRQYRAIALHLTADVSDQLRLGAVVLVDDAADGVALYGAEALYLDGPLRLEARLGDSFDNTDAHSLAELNGTYGISDRVNLRGGAFYLDVGDNGYYHVARLGLGYEVSDQTEVYVDLAAHTNNFGGASPTVNGSLVNVGMKFDLGGTGNDRLFNFHTWN